MGQAERGTAFALNLIVWIGLKIGRPAARGLLLPITLYFLLTAKHQRQASRLYLRRVLDHPVTWWHVGRHIHAFASTLLDRIYLLNDRSDRLDIRLHGVELLEAQAATGRGALLLGSHLGSFEVLRALAVIHRNLPLRILMYRHHNAVIQDMLDKMNPGLARTVIELGTADSMIRVGDALAKGCLVGILGDRVAESRKMTRCELLGGTVSFPTAPILLAHRLKVPILLFFGLYRGGNRYDVYFESFASTVTLDDARKAEQMQAWVQQYANRIAFHAKDAPYNWFNFYDVWGEMAA
jgi:predicted LPLAT superfamily acyltransferase